jgi:hypothetical protein
MKIYLDVCCLCRPFDDQKSHRIRMETEAVTAILARCTNDWILVGSEVIEYEIAAIIDNERMKNVQNLLKISKEWIEINKDISERAREYHSWGIDTFDSIHIACAEYAKATFLTTDDILIKVIMKHRDKITTHIKNPVPWFMEVIENGD